MAEHTFFLITLLGKNIIAPNILELRFSKPANFSFSPGQFVQFQIPDGEKNVLRSFSLSSAPHHDYLEFCIKILPDGKASVFLSGLPVGETAMISGAKGRFVCDSLGANYFIATGTGLAPITSMVSHLVERQTIQTTVVGQAGTAVREKFQTAVSEQPLSVLFGVRYAEDLFWVDRLHSFRSRIANYSVRVAVSRPTEQWLELRGRVSEHVIIDKEGHYYLCGSLDMVKDVRAILLKADVPAKNIHQEIY